MTPTPTVGEEEEEPERIPELEPITLKGTGDSIVDIDKPGVPMIVHIKGNAGSRYFGVTSYDKDGNQIDLLVNATEPYEGTAMLSQKATIVEVIAVGNWSIEITSK